ncbi:hypothetical protein BB558_001327 [Smittium angustum]|uniref:Protein kinase domain-containing protein n=1 Tax=Smittium angustum TaxID=133377 RepID=A0A2U1JBK6_SMIAN|nr:hypothetical protein BB558_001327 [Smittium angustum]
MNQNDTLSQENYSKTSLNPERELDNNNLEKNKVEGMSKSTNSNSQENALDSVLNVARSFGNATNNIPTKEKDLTNSQPRIFTNAEDLIKHQTKCSYSLRFTGCSPFSDYTLTSKVGEGTFGEVHKARHEKTGKLVALKRVLMHNEKEGIPITAIREIKILKSLKHDNIIPLIDMVVKHESGNENDQSQNKSSVFMVFPYMEHDLTGLLENPKVKLNISQIKLYLRQICEGTAYLHQNNVLHRDIKASNLLINNRGELFIADFGLARAYIPESQRDLTKCVVTRWYRPPELLLGERKYSSSIDLWGVGCIAAEMLIKRPLFPGKSDLDQLEQIFKMCGSPNKTNWPNWDQLPDVSIITGFGRYSRGIKEYFKKYGDNFADFMDSLLQLNPVNRMTAAEALNHSIFFTPPYPTKPEQMPKFESSHEYDRRKPGNQAHGQPHHNLKNLNEKGIEESRKVHGGIADQPKGVNPDFTHRERQNHRGYAREDSYNRDRNREPFGEKNWDRFKDRGRDWDNGWDKSKNVKGGDKSNLNDRGWEDRGNGWKNADSKDGTKLNDKGSSGWGWGNDPSY